MCNSIYELVKSHVCIFDTNLQNVKLPIGTDENGHISYENGVFQLDFLSWYVDENRIATYGLPGDVNQIGVKDNPNWVPTEFENVYIKTQYWGENVSIDYQLVLPGKSPVAILNWWYFKVRCGNSYKYRWRVSVGGKALKLYYMGYIQRLLKYIIKYSGECCRADLCRDFPCKIPDGIIDLKISGTNHGTTYFGEKNSPIFFRTYDKTKDLRREKNCFAWFYPERYKKECWRLEAQITGDYSRSQSLVDWLGIMKVDKSVIKKQEKLERNTYKTLLYSAVNTVDWINISQDEKLDILINTKRLLDLKIEKIRKGVLDFKKLTNDTDSN